MPALGLLLQSSSGGAHPPPPTGRAAVQPVLTTTRLNRAFILKPQGLLSWSADSFSPVSFSVQSRQTVPGTDAKGGRPPRAAAVSPSSGVGLMGEGSLGHLQTSSRTRGTQVLALCGPKSPSSPHPGLPQAQSNSKAPRVMAPSAGAKGDCQLTHHKCPRPRPGPGPVPPSPPAASSHPLGPPFQSHHGYLLCARPGRSQAHPRLMPASSYGEARLQKRWGVAQEGRRMRVTSGRLCGHPPADGQGGRSRPGDNTAQGRGA